MLTAMNSIGFPRIGAALEQAFGHHGMSVVGGAINGLFLVRELGIFPATPTSPVAEHIRIGSMLERFNHNHPAGAPQSGRQ